MNARAESNDSKNATTSLKIEEISNSEETMMQAFRCLENRLDNGERVSAYDLREFLNTVADTNEAGGDPSPGAGERFLREALHFRRVASTVDTDSNNSVSVLTWENTDTPEARPKRHRWFKAIF